MQYKLVKEMVQDLYSRPNVFHLDVEQLRRESEKYGIKTEFGNYNFSSSVRNRSAWATVYFGSERVRTKKLNPYQKEIVKNLPLTLEKLRGYLKRAPFVCVERKMGQNSEFTPHCTAYVSIHRKDCVRIAYMWTALLFDPEPDKEPHLYLVQIPEWQERERQILVFPEEGVTFVLGSDYLGEIKKGFLRMAMWFAKERGMLGIHAGAKLLRAKDSSGKIKRYSMLLFGLSGTGKTTHSCHHHYLNEEGEGVEIIQDDVVFLKEDGSILGTEKGFFLKTDIDPENQPLIYRAATQKDTVLENVMVDYQGKVYFLDDTLTGNGRGVIQRTDLGKENITDSINSPPLSELDGMIIAFITRRNTVLPIVSKLTPEQGAAAFMLGESIETSASDPRRIGESVRVVGTNPFIVGDETEEGNIFYRILKKNEDKLQCYLLNTGGVGEIVEEDENGNKVVRQPVTRVEIKEMAYIIRGIARGVIKWQRDPIWGTETPRKVEGVNIERFSPEKFYTPEQIKAYVEKLKKERIEYIKSFPNLDKKIVSAVENTG